MVFIAPEDELEVEEGFSAPEDELAMEDTGQSRAASMGSELGRGFGKVFTGSLEGLGQASQFMVRNVNPVGWAAMAGVPGAQELVDFASAPGRYVEGLGQAGTEKVEEMLPTNPLFADTMSQKAAGVVGQAGGQLTSLLTGAAFTKAPKILQALGLGQAGLLGLESGYAEADRLGVTEPWKRDALAASFAAAEAGVEGWGGFGTQGFARALTGQLRESLGKGAGTRFLKTVGGEAIEEPVTGTLQSGASNIFADEDPANPGFALNGQPLPSVNPLTTEFWGDRAEEALLGAVGGGVFGVAQFAGSRPKVEQIRALKQKADLQIDIMRENPNLTPSELQDLESLKAESDAAGEILAETEIQDEAEQIVQQSAQTAIQSAEAAGMPEVADTIAAAEPAFIAPEDELDPAEGIQIQTPTPSENAIQIQEPAQSLLREEGPQVELPAVGEGDAQRQEAPPTGQEATVTPTGEVLPISSVETTSVAENAPEATLQARETALAQARSVVESQKGVLPSAEDAWVGLREELAADPVVRQAYIANQQRIDPDLTAEEAGATFDAFVNNQRVEGFTFAGRTYILADGVGVTKKDKSFKGAIERLLKHEDTHIAIDTITQVNAKRRAEWEGMKKRIASEKLDDLVRRRYPSMSDWRNDSTALNDLAHEYFAEQMERDESGQTVDDRNLLEQFIAYMRKVMAQITGREVSLEEIREFVKAGRQARTQMMEQGGARTSLREAEDFTDPVSEDYLTGNISEPRFSMQPSYSAWSEERKAEYDDLLKSTPENGRQYVEFLASPTKTPRESQAVRPMVEFARAQMGSYQGDEVEVNPENTERVKELAMAAFNLNREAGADFAKGWSQKFRDSGFSGGTHEGSLATGVLQMEILDYSVRLAAETGDKSLALALMPFANDVAASDHASVSNSARALQLRSQAGQQQGFWTLLNGLAKGEREIAESNPIYRELREALFSNEVMTETAAGVQKDMGSTEAQTVLNPEQSPEELLDSLMGSALATLDEAERDLTIRLFNDMAELNILLEKMEMMQPPPAGVKASMKAAQAMSDPVAIQQRIDELKGNISTTLKALDSFKTSGIAKAARDKAINKTPRVKKVISADTQAKKLLERLANKPKRTKQDPPPWKKTFLEQVDNPKDDAAFGTEMASHGVDTATARKLFDEAAKLTSEAQKRKTETERRAADRKDTQAEVSAAKGRVRDQKRDMGRPARIADQKSFINSVMRQIFDGTIEQQSNPGWRRQVMVEAFKNEGFSQGSAENAADYLGSSLERHLKSAQEKAAHKAAKDLNMKKPTLEKMVRAIRSRAVDPLNADPVTKALAQEAGFIGITPEQFTELAKLDGQLKSQYQTLRAKAAARMLDIALAAKPPKSRMEILTQAWISSALSSISTMSLSALHAGFIPVRRLAFDVAGVATDVVTGKTKASDAPQIIANMMGNLMHSASYMLTTARYSGKNDAYTQHIVEFINQMHSMQADLQRAAATLRDPKATATQKGKAAIKLMFTSTDIVRRILSTADETWGTMIQDFILRNEAMRQLTQKGGLSPTAAAMLFAAASNEGRVAGERHRNETGNALEATLVEKDATNNAILEAVRDVAGEQASKDVAQTAAKDSPMELGNRRSEEAPLWDPVNTLMEWVKQLAITTRRKNELFGRALTGFVTVPANILNRSAYFTPLGIIRALYKKGKLGGDPAKIRQAYEETMGAEGQQRMRMIEGIVGTLLITMLMALTPDDDEEGLIVTGSGPEDKGLREAWLKKGNAPNRIQWVDKNGDVKFSVAYARGGFDHLNLAFTLVGTANDMKLKGIKPQPANVEWGTQYAHTMLKGLFDQAKFFGLKNVASMPTQMTDRSLASQAAYLAAPIVPWSGFTKSVGRLWTGPTDQSSVQSAMLAQFPFTSFFARPALNALGDQRGPGPRDAMWDRAVMTGAPAMVGAENKGPDADLYSMMIERGVAPNVPLRSMIERKNGLITDQKWADYLKTRGALIKKGIRRNLRRFKTMEHKDAQNLMEKISGDATRDTKAKLKLQ